MSLAIIGLGRSLPDASFTQEEAIRVAQVLCCRSPENETWLPAIYDQSGIGKRHTALGTAVVDDILNGTRLSNSVFLPGNSSDDRGPTTAERMKVYADRAPPLADQSNQKVLDRFACKFSAW
jgi:hypothetical protein